MKYAMQGTHVINAVRMFQKIHPDGAYITNDALCVIMDMLELHEGDDDTVYDCINATWPRHQSSYFAPGESSEVSLDEAAFFNLDEWYPREAPPGRFSFIHWVNSFEVLDYEYKR